MADGTIIDCSGIITTAGTPQPLTTATPINGFGIYNPDPTNDLWVSLNGNPALGVKGSVRVPANGGWFETPNGAKPSAIPNITGMINGQNFTAITW